MPRDEEKAGRSLYEVVDGILYHMEVNKTLRLIPPSCDQESLFQEVHSGTFGAHMKDAKIHGKVA